MTTIPPEEQAALEQALNNLTTVAHGMSVQNGFWDHLPPDAEPRLIKLAYMEKLALSVSELGESIEALRSDAADDKLTHMSGVLVEMADCVIRLLDLSGHMLSTGYCWDSLGEAIIAKMDYNAGREYMHGKGA